VKTALTDITIRSLKPGVYFDSKTPAFGIRVGALRKTWLVVRGKTRTQTVIGHYPQLGLADARAKAKALMLDAPEPKSKAPIFSEARTAYLVAHSGRPRTIKEVTRLLTKHFADLDTKQLPTITDTQITACMKDLPPSEGLHAFRACRAMLRWCVRPPRRYITHNPLEGFAPTASDGKGTRILSDSEVKSVLGAISGVSGAILKLMLLWGTRKGETLALRRDWIAGDVLTIPAEITKNGRPHTIPVLPLAQSILDTLPNKGPYYFPGKEPTSPLHDGSWTKLHRAILKASKTEGWSAHDCRRTFRSACARHGVPRDLAERLLNHAQGALDVIYDHHDYLEAKKNALALIESWLTSLLPSPRPGH
jgi:site-specific recombinase XerD